MSYKSSINEEYKFTRSIKVTQIFIENYIFPFHRSNKITVQKKREFLNSLHLSISHIYVCGLFHSYFLNLQKFKLVKKEDACQITCYHAVASSIIISFLNWITSLSYDQWVQNHAPSCSTWCFDTGYLWHSLASHSA